MATSVGEIALDLILNSEEFEKRVGEIAKKTGDTMKESTGFADSLDKVGKSSVSAGKSLLALSAPVVGIGVASTKAALNFEDSMAKVMTIADQTEMSYDDMEKAILDLSNQTGISANEIADNVYNAISAGQKTGDAVNFVSNSTKLARAGFADAGDALDILTTIMNAYKLEASEVTNVSDLLIQTQNKGKVTVGELSSSMGKIIPTANAFGVQLDQLCSGYAIMTANGVSCAESTTYMNSMLNELGKSASGVAKVLKSETGMSFDECMKSGMSLGDVLNILDQNAQKSGQKFTDLWGSSEAAKAGLILLGDEGKEFNAMLGEMTQSAGATDEAFKTLDTTQFNMQKAMNEIKNAGIELGGVLLETLTPVILAVCEAVSSACKWFNSLDDGVKKTIFVIAGIVAAVGGSLVVFGKLASGIGGIIKAVQTAKTVFSTLGGVLTALNPTVLIVVAIIGALIAIGVALYKNWDTIKEALGSLVECWKAGWGAIKEFFIGVWNGICDAVSTAWDAIKTGVTTSCEAIGSFMSSAWEGIKSVASTAWDGVKSIVSTAWNGIKTGCSTAINTTKSVISTGWNAVKTSTADQWNTTKTVVSTAWNAIKTGCSTSMSNTKSVLSTGWNAVKSATGTAWNGMKSTVNSAWNNMKSACSSSIGRVRSIIVSGLESAWSYIKSIPSKMFNWGKDMVQGLINGIKSMIGSVSSAVSGVANTVRSYLHFSCPDVGPLADYESWMPDFMKGLADGISSNKAIVQNAVNDIASIMKIDFSKLVVPTSGKLGFETPELKPKTEKQVEKEKTKEEIENSQSIQKLFDLFRQGMYDDGWVKGDIVIPVYVGGNIIDEVVVRAEDRRRLRSGGNA